MMAAPASEQEGPAGHEPDAPVFPERLSAVVRAFSDSGYAVLDGGLFEDLPLLLKRAGLFARSLFLDHADKEVEAAGPWLVALDQREDAPAEVFSLVGDRPAAVFWSCEGGDMVLHRHLRTLNMARIPAWAATGAREPPAAGGAETFEAVMFRHWDPRVLGALLPVLDAGQFARIVGPAWEIAFWAEDYGGLKQVPRHPDWPQPSSGMLTIQTEQMQALSGRRVGASRRHIESYVQDVAREEVAALPEGELTAILAHSERTGRELGLRSEQACGRWAYVMVRTRGRALEQPGLRAYLTDGVVPPDEKVQLLLKSMALLEASGARDR